MKKQFRLYLSGKKEMPFMYMLRLIIGIASFTVLFTIYIRQIIVISRENKHTMPATTEIECGQSKRKKKRVGDYIFIILGAAALIAILYNIIEHIIRM